MDTYAHLVSGTRDVAVNRVAEIVIRAPELEPAKEANESGSKMAATSMSSSNESPKNAANSMTESGSPGRSRTFRFSPFFDPFRTFHWRRYPHGPQIVEVAWGTLMRAAPPFSRCRCWFYDGLDRRYSNRL